MARAASAFRWRLTSASSKDGGKVVLSPSSPDDEVIITNKFTESEETEIETEVSTEKGTIQTPRTGDNTPIMLYVALMAIALVVVLLTGGAVISRRRKYFSCHIKRKWFGCTSNRRRCEYT